jgi:hypothetical protein
MTAPAWPRGYRLLAHPLALLISAALMAIAYGFMTQGLNGQALSQILGFQLAFTPAKAQQVIALWSEAGIAAYRGTLWLDFLFPLGYGLFTSGLLARTLINAGEAPDLRTRWLAAIPLVAVGCDYLENLLHWWMLSRGWPFDWLPLLAASSAAASKWGIMGFVILTLLALWTRQLINRLSPHSSRP